MFLVLTVKGEKQRVLKNPGTLPLLPVVGDSAEKSTKGEGRDALHLLQDGLLGNEAGVSVQRIWAAREGHGGGTTRLRGR